MNENDNLAQELAADNTQETTQETQNMDFDFQNNLDTFLKEQPDAKGETKRRRSSSFAGTNFEKLAQTEEDEKDLEAFFNKEKLFLVLTNAGKPVFTSQGDIYQLSPIIATLYAIISKVHTFSFKKEVNPFDQLDLIELEQSRSVAKMTQRMSVKLTTAKQSLFDVSQQVLLDRRPEDETSGLSQIFFLGTRSKRLKISFIHKGNCLIYLAVSKDPNESQSFLKKQLENLHCQIISIMTQNIIKTLQYNPSYDVVHDLQSYNGQINASLKNMTRDPAIFLNQFLTLRLHPMTRDAVEVCIKRFKPLSDFFYYGLILAERTVVGIIKNDGQISIVPTDINLIFNYINSNMTRLKSQQAPIFEPFCLPGMTEEYKLNLFISFDSDSSLKLVFICEDTNPDLVKELQACSYNVMKDFKMRRIIGNIEESEKEMFHKINLMEVQNVIISNTMLEQYTSFNFPLIAPEFMSANQIRSLHQFEQLYDRYQASQNQTDLFIKKVYALETYALFAKNNYVIMATIAHNRTNKEMCEVCSNIYEDALLDEESCFILKWF